jgi:hypothetical protein
VLVNNADDGWQAIEMQEKEELISSYLLSGTRLHSYSSVIRSREYHMNS